MDEQFAKKIEKAFDDQLKANGPVQPGKITLAVELDQVIESLETRIRQMQTIKTAVEAMKASL